MFPPKCKYPLEFRAFYLSKERTFYKEKEKCDKGHMIGGVTITVGYS
jgi:hypothetical protein